MAIRHTPLLFLIPFSVLFSFSVHAQETIRIQTEAWPPLVMQDTSGKPTGVDFEVMHAVFKELNRPYKLEFLPWKRVIKNLKSQSADAVLAIIATEERRDFLYFPEEPVSTGGYVIFHLSASPFEYSGLDSLTGKKVGAIGGYAYSDEFNSANNFTIEATVGEGALISNFRKLLAKRVDLVIANEQVGLYTASKLGILNRVSYSKNYVSGKSDFYLAFSQKPGNRELAQDFAEALKRFKTQPEYQQILSRYGLN